MRRETKVTNSKSVYRFILLFEECLCSNWLKMYISVKRYFLWCIFHGVKNHFDYFKTWSSLMLICVCVCVCVCIHSKDSFIVQFMSSLSLLYDKEVATALIWIMLVHTKTAALRSSWKIPISPCSFILITNKQLQLVMVLWVLHSLSHLRLSLLIITGFTDTGKESDIFFLSQIMLSSLTVLFFFLSVVTVGF